MKKLLLLIGLVLFLTPSVYAKTNCFMCLEMPCNDKRAYQTGQILQIENGYPESLEGWVKLNKKQCKAKLNQPIEINKNLDTSEGNNNTNKDGGQKDQESKILKELKKNIRILDQLYKDKEISKDQYDRLKENLIAKSLDIPITPENNTPKQNNKNEDEFLELERKQLEELKRKRQLEGQEQMLRGLCSLFFGLPNCM